MENIKLGSFMGVPMASSADPTKLSLRIQSGILGASSIIIFLGALLGVNISDVQVVDFAGNMAITVSTITTVISIVGMVYGWLRKMILSKTGN